LSRFGPREAKFRLHLHYPREETRLAASAKAARSLILSGPALETCDNASAAGRPLHLLRNLSSGCVVGAIPLYQRLLHVASRFLTCLCCRAGAALALPRQTATSAAARPHASLRAAVASTRKTASAVPCAFLHQPASICSAMFMSFCRFVRRCGGAASLCKPAPRCRKSAACSSS